jgi:hypothetical protein
MKKGGDDDDQKEEPRREEVVAAAPPEPEAPETLEARVEALETKVEDGEGYVQPRTGA